MQVRQLGNPSAAVRNACSSPALVAPLARARDTGVSRVPARAPAPAPVSQVRGSTILKTSMLERVQETAEQIGHEAPGRSAKDDFKVVIAGAGIGGLVLAVALLRKGIKVVVLERDMTAIRGEGKYRGPIQVQSNALAALQAIDPEVAAEVLAEGCMTGDRINGLCDGVTGDWYVKFDTYHAAVDRGLPITRVISRVSLQQILARAVEKYGGEGTILGNSHVLKFDEAVDPATGKETVSVQLEDGRTISGDILIGADGIRSNIRKQLIGESDPSYSQYTCYTGISDFTPADIDVVGYRVFLGNKQYFVSSDVGGGKMQWYAFNKEEAGGKDESARKTRLLDIFGHWNDNVVDLIKATPEEDILRRDIFDRPPIFTWWKNRVALLGDSAHAMQPNLGQGGCMAIEDAYELADILATDLEKREVQLKGVDVAPLFWNYQVQRTGRSSVIHGMAGMAAFMASTYKATLGEGLGFLEPITKLGIHHPGRVVGGIMMRLTMPGVLSWVLGGNTDKLVKNRVSSCAIDDKPRGFDESSFATFMNDDNAILKAISADWLLLTERASTNASADVNSSCEAKGIYIVDAGSVVGSSDSSQLHAVGNRVSASHARVWKVADGEYMVQDLASEHGTFMNGKKLASNLAVRVKPGDVLSFGGASLAEGASEIYKIKLQHVTLRTEGLRGKQFNTLLVGQKVPVFDKGMSGAAVAAA
eukprot:gene13206-19041_t